MKNSSKIIVLFVEGDTEAEFYNLLIKYYKAIAKKAFPEVKIFNLKGIGRFENRVPAKLKNHILCDKKNKGIDIKVFCCYDTDVFELAKKPPTNWAKVKKEVKELGINSFYEIKAERRIEDWFIKDLNGICDFLGINVPKKTSGDGLSLLKSLFKQCKKPKIYQKGSYTHKFLDKINISKIVSSLSGLFDQLEIDLNIKAKKST